jgi:hypothetical protein
LPRQQALGTVDDHIYCADRTVELSSDRALRPPRGMQIENAFIPSITRLLDLGPTILFGHVSDCNEVRGDAHRHRRNLRLRRLECFLPSRCHHLVKTFLGWRDHQLPDGTVEWLSPTGQRYTTHPGSRLQFPALCRPTAPAVVDPDAELADDAARGLKMPRRRRTRAQNRAQAIEAERNRPPP